MSFLSCSTIAIFSLLVLPAVGLEVQAVADADLNKRKVVADADLNKVNASYRAEKKVASDMQLIQSRIADVNLVLGESKALWMSDKLTGFGSSMHATNKSHLPVSTFYIGFDGCEGSTILGKVLRMHPGSIVGKSIEKNYFTSKTKGHCNRFAARDGVSEYDKYVKSCFQGKTPTLNRTTLDFSQSYAENGYTSVVSKIQDMANETNLRFLSVVCDPRQRAVNAVQEELVANSSNGVVTADDISNSISYALRKHRAGSYSHNIGGGEYARILSGWATNFPLDSLLVVNSEALNDIRTWRRIFTHIGLPVPSDWKVKKWLKGVETPKRSPDILDQLVKRRLDDHYLPYDTSLWGMMDVKYW